MMIDILSSKDLLDSLKWFIRLNIFKNVVELNAEEIYQEVIKPFDSDIDFLSDEEQRERKNEIILLLENLNENTIGIADMSPFVDTLIDLYAFNLVLNIDNLDHNS
jgi:hypothetical protein